MPPSRKALNNLDTSDLNKRTTRSGKTYALPYPSPTRTSAKRGSNAFHDASEPEPTKKPKADNGSNSKAKSALQSEDKHKGSTRKTAQKPGTKKRDAQKQKKRMNQDPKNIAVQVVEDASDMTQLKYLAICPEPSYAHTPNAYEDYRNWGYELDGLPADYPWVASEKVMELLNVHNFETMKRDQDAFDMHIYSDYTGYGAQEVLENQMILFTAAMKDSEPNALRLWTILSAFAHWAKINGEIMCQWSGRDDADGWSDSNFMVGMMVLATLNSLERAGLLVENSPLKDLGFVLALIGDFVYGEWEIQEEVPFFTRDEESTTENEPPIEACWPYIIVDYAKRHGIKIHGVLGVEDGFLKKFDDLEKAKLWNPQPGPDRWGWESKWAHFVEKNGHEVTDRSGNVRLVVGGNAYDLMRLSKKERIGANLLNEGPLDEQNPRNVLGLFEHSLSIDYSDSE